MNNNKCRLHTAHNSLFRAHYLRINIPSSRYLPYYSLAHWHPGTLRIIHNIFFFSLSRRYFLIIDFALQTANECKCAHFVCQNIEIEQASCGERANVQCAAHSVTLKRENGFDAIKFMHRTINKIFHLGRNLMPECMIARSAFYVYSFWWINLWPFSGKQGGSRTKESHVFSL